MEKNNEPRQGTKLKVNKETFDLSRGIPVNQQKWRSHLVMVDCGAVKHVGLVAQVSSVKKGEGFTLHYALNYAPPQIQIMPSGKPGHAKIAAVTPPVMIPFDTMGEATLRVGSYNVALVVKDQPSEKLREYFFETYQSHFAPSSIKLVGANQLPTPGADPLASR